MMSFMNWKKRAEKKRELLAKNIARDANEDIQQSVQATNPKNILIPKKVPPITPEGIADINKRNFIKKGILGLIAGLGIAAFSKTAQAWSGFIKFPDETSQGSADIDASKITSGRFGLNRLGWTTDKLLKGAGATSDPIEIDVPAGKSIASGNYTGNSGDNRQITTGFQCSFVMVMNPSEQKVWIVIGTAAGVKIRSVADFYSTQSENVLLHASDGFIVDDGAGGSTPNWSGRTYHYWAIST